MKAEDCNNCTRTCNPVIQDKFGNRYPKKIVKKGDTFIPFVCPGQKPTRGTFMLAELALSYPTSLNEALSALPFDCNLNFYLRR